MIQNSMTFFRTWNENGENMANARLRGGFHHRNNEVFGRVRSEKPIGVSGRQIDTRRFSATLDG